MKNTSETKKSMGSSKKTAPKDVEVEIDEYEFDDSSCGCGCKNNKLRY